MTLWTSVLLWLAGTSTVLLVLTAVRSERMERERDAARKVADDALETMEAATKEVQRLQQVVGESVALIGLFSLVPPDERSVQRACAEFMGRHGYKASIESMTPIKEQQRPM